MLENNSPESLWGVGALHRVYVANRSPHSSLGGEMLSFKMYDKNTVVMSVLRSIDSKAFVHTEIYTSNFEDRPREGALYGYSTTSKASRIHKPSMRRAVRSQTVTFFKTPPSNLPPVEIARRTMTTFLTCLISRQHSGKHKMRSWTHNQLF